MVYGKLIAKGSLIETVISLAAPTLAKIKPSSVLCLDKDYEQLRAELAASDIKLTELYVCKDKPVIMLYNAELLQKSLNAKKAKSLLKKYGYPQSYNVEDYIDRLSERLNEYKDKRAGFPHEIGVFLGYPVEDVQDFIEKGGKLCHFCRYWKVYNRPAKAYRTSRIYEEVSQKMLNLYQNGYELKDLTDQSSLYRS